MNRLPIVLMPGLLAALLTASPALPLASGQPERALSTPSPGLRLTTLLDGARLQPGRPLQLKVDLRNEGAGQVPIPGAGRCDPALQLTIWGADGGVAWAQGLPLCQEYGRDPLPIVLAAGGSISATRCLALAVDAARLGGRCALVDLPSGTYQVGGNFHGMTLPRLEITLAP